MVSLAPTSISVHGRTPRIEILGVFGSGKSTLAATLASTSSLECLPEDHSKNPFWGQANAIRRAGQLPYDLSFMIQHAYLAASSLRSGSSAGICDWSFATDRLWASMRLEHDIAIYSAAQDAVLERVGAACGYLYLKQPAELIMERIRGRGRVQESEFHNFIERAVSAVDLIANQLPKDKLQIVGDDNIHLALVCIENWLRKEDK